MMRFHHEWLLGASAFLIPWGVLFVLNAGRRSAGWRTNPVTALFGFTPPIFVSRSGNPPSLFGLAPRARFENASLIFPSAVTGYIGFGWNLPALSGVLIGGAQFARLLLGLTFGMYRSSASERCTPPTGAPCGARGHAEGGPRGSDPRAIARSPA
jgi:hypothetical protein